MTRMLLFLLFNYWIREYLLLCILIYMLILMLQYVILRLVYYINK